MYNTWDEPFPDTLCATVMVSCILFSFYLIYYCFLSGGRIRQQVKKLAALTTETSRRDRERVIIAGGANNWQEAKMLMQEKEVENLSLETRKREFELIYKDKFQFAKEANEYWESFENHAPWLADYWVAQEPRLGQLEAYDRASLYSEMTRFFTVYAQDTRLTRDQKRMARQTIVAFCDAHPIRGAAPSLQGFRNSVSLLGFTLQGGTSWTSAYNATGKRINCLPDGVVVGWSCPPLPQKTRGRQHLQLILPEIDEVLSVLDRAEGIDTLSHRRTDGFNRVNTPNTGVDELHDAMLKRHRLNDPTRPSIIKDRHLKGYSNAVRELYNILDAVVERKKPPRPDVRRRFERYTGTKRRHFELCGIEFERTFTNDKALARRIYHEASVKWGELSDRPRAILVQSVRSAGPTGVKKGTPLRLPIAIEGGYRDHYEEALHHYLHKRGFHMVASGMDSFKRGRVIRDMVEPGDMVLSCDWSSFDGSLGLLGNVERDEFLRVCERRWGRDGSLRAVLDTQKVCTVKCGAYRAKLFGNRGSGTAGTSTGNKVVVLSALAYALGPALKGKGACKLLCDGDDTLIVVPKRWQGNSPSGQPWYQSWARRLTELGLETKIQQLIVGDQFTDACDELRFCRAGVITTSRGPMLCKVPSDAVRVMTNYRRHFRGNRFCDYLQTLHDGWSHVYGDVPVLSALTDFFDVGGRVDKQLYDGAGLEYMLQQHKSGKPGKITMEHRESFARTFKVPVAQQIRCESLLREASKHAKQLFSAGRFTNPEPGIWTKNLTGFSA